MAARRLIGGLISPEAALSGRPKKMSGITGLKHFVLGEKTITWALEKILKFGPKMKAVVGALILPSS